MKKNLIALSLAAFIGTTAVSSGPAQQITGTPGSPSATTTIDGAQLPAPPPKFGGKIEREATGRSLFGRHASCHRRAHQMSC